MSKLRVLISGASVAGPALAYRLVREGCQATIVERAPILQRAGQGLDVRESARGVIKRMGIFDHMRDKSSHEEGLRIVSSKNRPLASFAVDLQSGKGHSPTCDIEILKGKLAGILFAITQDNVRYIFDDMVESLQETDQEVRVVFANGTPFSPFDLVVTADNIDSKIRGPAFGRDGAEVRSLNAYVSYVSIAPGDTDSMWARAHWIKGG